MLTLFKTTLNQITNVRKWTKVIKNDTNDSNNIPEILFYKYNNIKLNFLKSEEQYSEDNTSWVADLKILNMILDDLNILMKINQDEFNHPVFENLEGESNIEDYREKIQTRVFGRIGRNLEKFYI